MERMERTMMMLRVGFLGVAVLTSVLSIGCGGAKPSAVEVTAREFAFGPGEVHMKVGQRTQLRMRNDGQLLHDWTIDSMPASGMEVRQTGQHDMPMMATPGPGLVMAHMAAEHGTTSMMTFTPTKAGTYSYYCSVAGHREAGMQGRLIVE